MLSYTKLTILLWSFFLFVGYVQCRSFVLSSQHHIPLVKREIVSEVAAKDILKPDIYSFTVTSGIAYRYATTTVSNRVANPANVSKEIAFTVTLPDSAFISNFLMVIEDKVYKAYVKEKEEAKKDYQEAIDRGETAGHVELSARDSNLFTVSVNVEPTSKVTFNVTYEQLLTRTLGQYENIINVNPGQVVKSFKIEVNVEESGTISSLEVPDFKTSNEIDSNDSKIINVTIKRPTNNTAQITWIPDDIQQQQISDKGVKGQLVVRYDVDRTTNSNQILIDEGYFVHFYAPANFKTLNKHVIFALDISGSMVGRKIEQLREALTLILNDIGDGDYFSLILFSDNVQLWTIKGTIGEASPTWYYDETQIQTTTPADLEVNEHFIVPANAENIAKAKAFASTLNETGGTNIIAALRKSLQVAQWGQKQECIKAKPLIIFLTDGQPNVEMSDPEEIVKAVRKQNVGKYPLFSLAFGDGADYDFLRKLSLSNSGFARNIYVASDTTLQLNNFYKQVASPLLSNVVFNYIPGQFDETTLTKSIFDNLYNGSELVVAGKLSDTSKSIQGNLTGTTNDGFFCIEMPPLIPVSSTPGHLEKLWSYLYIKELLDKDLISDEKNSTFKQKALNLSLHYGFVTPLTSLVIVKPNETASTGIIRNPSEIEGVGQLFSSSNFALRGPSNLASSALLFGAPTSTSNRIVQSSISLGQQAIAEEDNVDFSASEIILTKSLNISNVSWLKNKTEIKFPLSNNSYTVFSGDSPNTEFQSCLVPNSDNTTLSHCRHLAHCVIPEIVNSFEDFVPYGEGCVIDARFVGICCPANFNKQKIESTSTRPISSLTSSINTTVTQASTQMTTS